jgi:hypothetical protein
LEGSSLLLPGLYQAKLPEKAACPAPGMGAERMLMTWSAGFLLLSDAGYQPRHRSKRRAGLGLGRLTQRTREDASCARVGRPAGPRETQIASWLSSPAAEPALPYRPERGQLVRMLEACAVDDLTRIIPQIVQVVAHSSGETKTTAWNDFREATKKARPLGLDGHDCPFLHPANPGSYPQEDAVVIKVGQANNVWWLITNGLP